MASIKILFVSVALLFSGCGVNSSSSGTNNSDYVEETINNEEPRQEGIQLTGRMETCNKCMGYGMVQNGMSGQPQICKFCWMSTNMLMQQGWTGFDGRYGMVDAAFNRLPADYFDYLDAGDGVQTDDGGASRAQIEAEIERHLQNIEALERQLDYIEGTVNRTHLQQQIIMEQQEVRRLKNMLE